MKTLHEPATQKQDEAPEASVAFTELEMERFTRFAEERERKKEAAARKEIGVTHRSGIFRLTGPVEVQYPAHHCSRGATWAASSWPPEALCKGDHFQPSRDLKVHPGELIELPPGHRPLAASHWREVGAEERGDEPTLEDRERLRPYRASVHRAEETVKNRGRDLELLEEQQAVINQRRKELTEDLVTRRQILEGARVKFEEYFAGKPAAWREALERSGTSAAPPPRAPSVDDRLDAAVASGRLSSSQVSTVRGRVATGVSIETAISEAPRVSG